MGSADMEPTGGDSFAGKMRLELPTKDNRWSS
jgi:hypothetical protein